MALSEEEKQKIKEEEEYRASVRSEHASKQEIVVHHKKGHGCLIAFLIIIGFPFILAIVLVAINPAKQFDTAEKNAGQTQDIEIKNGTFTDFTGKEYVYEISNQADNSKYVASFKPFLVNDDRVLTQAILDVIGKVYGENAQIKLEPVLEPRNGVNLIRFDSDDGYYYFSPIKEDTGEIHTLVFWKE